MENQMNIGNQNVRQIGQNQVNQPVIIPEKPKVNYLMIGGIIFACFLIFGFGGFYIGKQSLNNEKQKQVLSSPSLSVSNSVVNGNKILQPAANCITSFSSKYLKMSFKYDGCVWKLSENLITPEAGAYSTITATHDSNHQIIISANTMGMGGGYPGCSKVNDITLLDNDVVRFHMVKNPIGETPNYYYYLNLNSNYAIKEYTGKYGDEKFNEYFTFLNPEAFPNTNMCWRSGGINPVAVLQPKEGETESYQINKDITVSIKEENVSDKIFLMSADALAVSVYSGLTQ